MITHQKWILSGETGFNAYELVEGALYDSKCKNET